MVFVTPGIDLLGQGLILLGSYFGTVVSVHSLVATRYGYQLPTWVVVSGAALSIPIFSTVYIMSRKLMLRRRAASMGARLVPEVPGKRLGNLDILGEMMEKLKTGYPGAPRLTISLRNTF